MAADVLQFTTRTKRRQLARFVVGEARAGSVLVKLALTGGRVHTVELTPDAAMTFARGLIALAETARAEGSEDT